MATEKQCQSCNTTFTCGDTLTTVCWCNEFPPILDIANAENCLCPTCLHQVTLQKVTAFVTMVKEKGIAYNDAPRYITNTSLIPKLDYYIEDGKWVFTAWYHLKRGKCCHNGCRHCPYN
jgi:hypothetical protein